MDRRTFLATATASMAAMTGLGSTALAAASQFSRAFRSPPDSGFPRTPLRLIAGKRPTDFVGTYFLNGPAKHERGGVRYDHWFDGDGMVHAFRFGEGTATHEGRFVETPKFKTEQAAGRLRYPGFDTLPADPAPVTKSDDMNVANISVLPVGDQLWALWEGGSATAIRPGDLSTEGFVVLGDGLEGVPFSAHPRVDPDGRIWNFGNVAFTGQLLLYQLSPTGQLEKFKLLNGVPKSMVHDFVATDKHLIVGFAPFLNEADDVPGGYLDRFRWHPDQAREYWVLDKENFEVRQRYETPAAFVFHHFNAWEETDGTIRFGAAAYENTRFVEVDARGMMQGRPPSGENEAHFEAITLYTDGRVSVEPSNQRAEFPTVDPRLSGLAATSFHVSGKTDASFNNRLMARAADGNVTGQWSAEADTLIGEHIVIPRPNGASWLMGTQFDAMRGRHLLTLFDSAKISIGPVAVWQTESVLPLPLHGCWMGPRD